MPGYNYRLTEFQAALGLTQMGKLQRVVDGRRRAAAVYDRLLAGTALQPPRILAGASHVYQSYVALLPEAAAGRRREIIAAARIAGVETQVGTIHMPLTTFFRTRYSHSAGDFPVTDSVASRALTLPLYEKITPDEQRTATDVILGLVA